MVSEKVSQAEKVLLSFYNLTQRKPDKKFTLEDLAVAAWLDNPTELCMRGYKEHPDVKRIERIISNLKSRNYVSGNAYNYRLTNNGIAYIGRLNKGSSRETKDAKILESAEASRKVHVEIIRLINSKIFQEYVKSKVNSEKIDLLESDFFEFLGASTRSLATERDKKQIFMPKYYFVVNELIPFCKTKSETDKNAFIIVELWNILLKKFGSIAGVIK